MTTFELNNRTNSLSLDESKKSKINYVPINEISDNPLNSIYETNDSEDELYSLIDSIKETGLQMPLSVSKSNNNYILISGHRRLKAIKRMLSDNVSITFNGISIHKDNIPIIIMREYKTEEEQFKALIASNNYRNISKESREKIIEKAIKIYNDNFSKYTASDDHTRDIIGKIAGVSGRTISRYVEFDQNLHAKIKNKQLTDDQMIINKINSMIRYIKKLDLNALGNLEKKNVKEKILELTEAVSSINE